MILFFFFGLSVTIFLLLLTLVKKNKNDADYILATWMGFMALHLALFILDYSRLSHEYPHLLGVLLPLPILHGFFLYNYTLQITANRLPSPKVIFLNLVPFLLLIILAIPFYALPGDEKLVVYQNQGKGYEWYSAIQMALFVIFGLAYSLTSINRIRKHRKQLLDVFSNHERKKLIWLEWMSFGLAGIWLLALFFNDLIVFSGVVVFILFIGIFGINQTPVFIPDPVEDKRGPGVENLSMPEPTSEKYQKSGLSEGDASRVSESLETYMQVNKPYKNPDLTLDELAALLKMHPHQLSQVINSGVGKTFYHYVNSYRIKEFLFLASLPDSSRFTFLGLASDCGFQSKTTFNKYFKLETGKTPSEYFQTMRMVETNPD